MARKHAARDERKLYWVDIPGAQGSYGCMKTFDKIWRRVGAAGKGLGGCVRKW